jgi:hypothetical protein
VDQETAQGSIKPRISAADVAAHQRVCLLKIGQPVMIGEQKAIFDGVAGSVPVFKIKGRLNYIKLGDPRLLEVKT